MFTSVVHLILSFCVVCCAANLEWVRLTNDNFTADIHTHPFLLCIATVPWCGESRSIMRSLSKTIEADEELSSAIQLRVVYINFDKFLDATILRRTKYPALTFFRHSTPYQYKGKLKAQNILAGIHHGITFNSRDLPFKKLETASELSIFTESTDKATILFDFCNYSEKFHFSKQHQVFDEAVDPRQSIGMNTIIEERVMQSSYSEGLEVVEQFSADLLFRSIDGQSGAREIEKEKTKDSNGYVPQEDKEVNLLPADESEAFADKNTAVGSLNLYDITMNKNDVKNSFVGCQMETDTFSANSVPSFPRTAFSSSFRSARFSQSPDCNRTSYKDFRRVYRNLTEVVRSYALTPEHASFALIKNRTLLADLGLDQMQNATWFLMQWIPDQPHLPRLYLGNENLESFLESSDRLVLELNREVINDLSTTISNSSAVILFVDRASSLLEVRRKSWEALTAVRAIARDYVGEENREMGVSHTSVDRGKERRPIKEDEPTPIRSGMSTESLLSLKDLVGQGTFQLLKDQPVTVQKEITGKDQSLPSEAAAQDSRVVLKFLVEDGNKLLLKGSSQSTISDNSEGLDLSKVLLSEDNAIFKVHEGKIAKIGETDHIVSSVMDLQSLFTTVTGSSGRQENFQFKQDIDESVADNEDIKMAPEKSTTVMGKHGLSFYFVDGDDQWKESISPGLPYPSLVILDFFKGGQYVFPTTNQSINYLSLKAFMDQFSKGNLEKKYASEVTHQKFRQQVQPPFVNRDFHEINGVPRVTTENLLQVISGSWMPADSFPWLSLHCTKNLGSSQKRDSLVLFTIPACGFCKRLELVFREVHQLLTVKLEELGCDGFLEQMTKHFNSGAEMRKNMEWLLSEGACTRSEVSKLKENLPCLLQIDCSANDCRNFFNSLNQKEVYPSILLYRGGNKASPIVFEGGSKVQEILNFIAEKSKTSAKILHILQGDTQRKRWNSTFMRQMGCHSPPPSPIKSIHLDSSTVRRAYHFSEDTGKMRPSSSATNIGDGEDQNQNNLRPIVYPSISSVLLATDQLSKASEVFASSKILIVKADGQEGFHGLILNKPLEWEQLPQGLGREMEGSINRTLLCYGGPVLVTGQPFLSLSRLRDVEGFAEVLPGVQFGGLSATSQVLDSIKEGKLEAMDFWFFLGQTVWGWQQLLNEIGHNLWNLTSFEESSVHLAVKGWLDGSRLSAMDVLQSV